MEKWSAVAQVVAPIFAAVLMGMFARRKNLLTLKEVKGMQQYVMKFGLPCVLFNSCLGAAMNAESIASFAMVLPTIFLSTLFAFFMLRKKMPYHNLPMLFAAQESVQKPMLKLDEDLYYDMLSAFCKSLRGSDPDAALLWFSRLLYAGVDPKLIMRRVIVHASEDVGLAEPTAMLQAQAAVTALEFVGMPEARIPIAQAIIAVCLAEKSNSVVEALGAAEADARNGHFSAVPVYLRDQSYAVKHSQTPQYKFPHDYPGHFVRQTYMPEGYERRVYYHPTEQGHEAKLRARHQRRYGAEKE